MSATMSEIIKAESGGATCLRVGLQELLNAPLSGKREQFLRFCADGRLPVVVPPKKEPEISAEELQQRRLEEMEREVYQRVFAAAESAGLKAGEEKMEREIQRLVPQLEGVLANLSTLHVRVLAASERYLVETALVLIKELLAYELTIHPEELTARIKRILSRASGRKEIVVHLSPGNAQLLARLNLLPNLHIEADENLSAGSVRLESDFGGMEDNLESQLKEVELSMRDYLQERLDGHGVEPFSARAHEAMVEASNQPPLPLVADPVPPLALPVEPLDAVNPVAKPEPSPIAAALKSEPPEVMASVIEPDSFDEEEDGALSAIDVDSLFDLADAESEEVDEEMELASGASDTFEDDSFADESLAVSATSEDFSLVDDAVIDESLAVSATSEDFSLDGDEMVDDAATDEELAALMAGLERQMASVDEDELSASDDEVDKS